MNLDQAMQERRSIRGFQKKPVSREVLEEVIALANPRTFVHEHTAVAFACSDR